MTTNKCPDAVSFSSIDDAKTALGGVEEWEWGGKASLEGCVDYVWRQSDGESNIDELICSYLLFVGENPEDYGYVSLGDSNYEPK